MNRHAEKSNWLVITDLDGTLLDHHTYSWSAAQAALDFLHRKNIPVVINTSKTAAEVHSLQKQIGLDAPFIVENGSAICLPPNSTTQTIASAETLDSTEGEEYPRLKILGQQKHYILNALNTLRERYQWRFEGFSDWSPAQIVQHTGLSLGAAQEAAQREYSEAIVWNDSEENYLSFKTCVEDHALKLLVGGRFIHVLGQTNKGKAAQWLKSNYEKFAQHTYKLIALGDGNNDIDMLNVADYAVLVKSPAHDYPTIQNTRNCIYTKEYGPAGWLEAIEQLKPLIT